MAKRRTAMPARLPPLDERELARLAAFRAREGVLSLYVNLAPQAGERRDARAALVDAVRAVDTTRLSARHRERWPEERALVREFARKQFAVQGRSAIVFSCKPRNLWRVFQLQIPVRPLSRFTERPAIAQLAAVLDEHERYLVALVNKDEARLFSVYLNQPEARAQITDEYPGRNRRGGWAEARYARHRDVHLHTHVLHVTEALLEEQRRHPFDRLLVGGPDEARAALLQTFPAGLRSRVAGSFLAEMFLTDDDVLARVRDHELAAQRADQGSLVQDLINAAAGGRATLGWDETLATLQQGRVHKLVMSEGRTRSGLVCPEGHAALIEPLEHCPVCRGPLTQIADMAEWAAEKALDTDARVQELHAYAAEALNDRGDGIGAVLRW